MKSINATAFFGILLAAVVGVCLLPVDILAKGQPNICFAVTIASAVLLLCALMVVAISGQLYDILTSFAGDELEAYRENYKNRVMLRTILPLLLVVVLILSIVLQVLPTDGFLFFAIGKLFIFLTILALCHSFNLPILMCEAYLNKFELLMLKKGAPPAP